MMEVASLCNLNIITHHKRLYRLFSLFYLSSICFINLEVPFDEYVFFFLSWWWSEEVLCLDWCESPAMLVVYMFVLYVFMFFYPLYLMSDSSVLFYLTYHDGTRIACSNLNLVLLHLYMAHVSLSFLWSTTRNHIPNDQMRPIDPWLI